MTHASGTLATPACAESCTRETRCGTQKAQRPIMGRGALDQGCNCAAPKVHTEALAPQDHAAECAGVGAVGHSVMGVAPVGAQAAEVYVVAVRKLSRGESGMTDRRIAEPDMQSWPQSGTQIFQPQNLCSVP